MDHVGVLVLIPIFGIVFSFATVVGVVWVVARNRQRSAQHRADVQMKLIDKFGSSAEFVKFLESPAGRDFLPDRTRRPRDRVLGAITAGIILTFLGIAFAICGMVEHDPGWYIPASILTGLGLAFFISAAISWKLTRKWEGAQQPPGSISAVS